MTTFRVGDRVRVLPEYANSVEVDPSFIGLVGEVVEDRRAGVWPVSVRFAGLGTECFRHAELELVDPAPVNAPAVIACTNCGEPIEPDDGGAIWFHADTMETWCGPVLDTHGGLDPQASPPEPQPYDMPDPRDDALDRIADLLRDNAHVDAIKGEVGRSPSEIYTTMSSGRLRDVVRTLDTIGSILRETGRL